MAADRAARPRVALHRRRRDRRRLGGAARRERRRRRRPRPPSRGAATRAARCSTNAERAWAPPHDGAAAPRHGHVRRLRRRGRGGGERGAGERTGGRVAEAATARGDRPARARGRARLLVDLGAAPVRAAGRHGPAGALRRRAPVQPRLPAAARRGRGRRADGRRGRRRGRRRSTPRSGWFRCTCAARSTASSPTGCSRRSGGRRSGSSTTASRRPARSTTRSATGRASAGRRWAPSSPTGSPAARATCATSSRSSGLPCSGRGRG